MRTTNIPCSLFLMTSWLQLLSSSVFGSHTPKQGEKKLIQIPDIIEKIETAEAISPKNVRGLDDIHKFTNQLYDRISSPHERHQVYGDLNIPGSEKRLKDKRDGSFDTRNEKLVSENKLKNGFVSVDQYVDDFIVRDTDLLLSSAKKSSNIFHDPAHTSLFAIPDNTADSMSLFDSSPHRGKVHHSNAHGKNAKAGHYNNRNGDTRRAKDAQLVRRVNAHTDSDLDKTGFYDNRRESTAINNNLENDFRRCDPPECFNTIQKNPEHHNPSKPADSFFAPFRSTSKDESNIYIPTKIGAEKLGVDSSKQTKTPESGFISRLFNKDFKVFQLPDNYPAYPVFEKPQVAFDEGFTNAESIVGKLLNNLIDIEEHTKSIVQQNI